MRLFQGLFGKTNLSPGGGKVLLIANPPGEEMMPCVENKHADKNKVY